MSDRLTAMDVENQEFRTRMRGYDPEEVRMFLKSVGEEIGRLNLANGELKEELGRLRHEVDEFRTRERTLQDTLVTAQRVSDDLRQKTTAESELMIREARLKAEKLLETAQESLAEIESEISRARLEREMFENRVRSVVEEHLTMIDLRRDERSRGDNIRFLRRRAGTEAG